MRTESVAPQRTFDAILFDLDGVVTRTADVHAEAWRRVFDELREDRVARGLGDFRPFEIDTDYPRHVDGKLRLDGARDFLASRGISLPERSGGTESGALDSLSSIGDRKNAIFRSLLERGGVTTYEDAVSTLDRLRAAGLRIAAVSSSRNARAVLASADLADRFDVCVDGEDIARAGLPGKPAPDAFLEAARLVGVPPSRAVVVEDAPAGVLAGRRGHFGCVIGVARGGEVDAERLREAGADVVVPRVDAWSYDPSPAAVPPLDVHARAVDAWTLAYEGYRPEEEKLREALCTLGNGYFATRGAAEESNADEVHYPGTYVHGGYDRLATEIADRVVVNEDLVNFPNWLPLTFRPEGGTWFELDAYEVLAYRQNLRLREGVLERRLRFRDPEGRITSLRTRRIVSMADAHLAAIEWELVPENWSGRIEIASGLDGGVRNGNVARYAALRDDHLRTIDQGVEKCGIWLEVETHQSRIRMVQAARTTCFVENRPAKTPGCTVTRALPLLH